MRGRSCLCLCFISESALEIWVIFGTVKSVIKLVCRNYFWSLLVWFNCLLIYEQGLLSQYSVWLRSGCPGFDPLQGAKDIFLVLRPDRLWGSPSLLSKDYQWPTPSEVMRGRGVTLTDHKHSHLLLSRCHEGIWASLKRLKRRVASELYFTV